MPGADSAYRQYASRLRDLRAYLGRPPTAEEAMFGSVPVRFDEDDDDVDYEALYGEP